MGLSRRWRWPLRCLSSHPSRHGPATGLPERMGFDADYLSQRCDPGDPRLSAPGSVVLLLASGEPCVALLWRFHNAHHIDPDLDVSTAVRFHPVEIGYSAAFRAVQVLVIGGPVWVFVAYETVFQFATLFHHSNVRFPIRIERWLNFILVTPRMHGIHHSEEFDETNFNWSSVFSWWDRLHRTLRLNVSQSIIDIGIAGYSLPHDNTVRATLAMPFGYAAGLLARCRRQGSGAPK